MVYILIFVLIMTFCFAFFVERVCSFVRFVSLIDSCGFFQGVSYFLEVSFEVLLIAFLKVNCQQMEFAVNQSHFSIFATFSRIIGEVKYMYLKIINSSDSAVFCSQ